MKEEMTASTMDHESSGGLANKTLLNKIDKLRELNVGSIVPLPQLVVVGDQSSGKSSVLESLTGFSFPRAAGLCTRYATQITCSREAQKSVTISIIPHPGSDAARQEKLRAFNRHVPEQDPQDDFAQIFEDANKAMGIRIDDEETDSSASTFSQDILKIEITGPEENHLTVIDVPGIFRTSTPGLTTESDISLVNNMVKEYMRDSRTIILAVIPCNVDIATQEILKLATDADPKGIRTMGVLTKPDLVVERATRQCVLDLVLGKRNDLSLGYCIVKNRGADDQASSLKKRHSDEHSFFRNEQWSPIANTGRVGIEALKQRLSELLMDISRREFPLVKQEIKRRLEEASRNLEAMGESRADARSQRAYLTKCSMEFQRVVAFALNAYYTEHPIFDDRQEARLITRIVTLNDAFSDVFATKGHKREFNGDDNKEGPTTQNSDSSDDDDPDDRVVDFDVGSSELEDIRDIIQDVDFKYECESPGTDSIIKHIEDVFNNSRGPELGTFGGSLLGTIFKEQSEKWEPLVLAHVSNAIAVVHDFILVAMKACFPDSSIRYELWDSILLEEIRAAYARAMQHTHFLLNIERNGKPLTVNHYFNANLQRDRNSRLQNAISGIAEPDEEDEGSDGGFNGNNNQGVGTTLMITLECIRSLTMNKSNAEQVREDIHDILKSYYKVSRKRFVDVVCQQVVDHFLLNGGDGVSPLRVFSPDRVARMSDEQLDAIAGEDAGTKRARERLAAEVAQLGEAMKVLRG